MNVRRAIAVLSAAALLLALPPADAAAAKPAQSLLAGAAPAGHGLALLGRRASGRSALSPRFFEIRFRNQDGYTIVVLAYRQIVALTVIHRDGKTRPSTATYLAHGRVTRRSIEASFGDRGRISLRFRPTGRALHASARAGCTNTSHRVVADLGLFVGGLRFDGEGGYTSVNVHRVHGGEVNLLALLRCLRGARPPEPLAAAATVPEVETHPSPARHERAVLLVNNKLPLSRVVFAAVARQGEDTRFLAIQAVSEGQVGIVRFVAIAGPPSTFAIDDAFSRAVVAPPPPFSGRAVLAHGPGSEKSWGGPLAVSFLGAPRVPLTGPPFDVRLQGSLLPARGRR